MILFLDSYLFAAGCQVQRSCEVSVPEGRITHIKWWADGSKEEVMRDAPRRVGCRPPLSANVDQGWPEPVVFEPAPDGAVRFKALP